MGGENKRFLVSDAPTPQYTPHAGLPHIELNLLISGLHRAIFCPIPSGRSRDIIRRLQQPSG